MLDAVLDEQAQSGPPDEELEEEVEILRLRKNSSLLAAEASFVERDGCRRASGAVDGSTFAGGRWWTRRASAMRNARGSPSGA